MRSLICVLIGFFLLLPPAVAAQEGARDVTIGTAPPTGVYYQVAHALAKVLQRQPAAGIKAVPRPSAGSDTNIDNIVAGHLEFAIVQADRLFHAVNGSGLWADRGPQGQLRAVMALYPEALTLLASEKSGIKSLGDLPGKRVNIGNPGSGTREAVESLLKFIGLWDAIEPAGKDPLAAIDDLLRGKLDAAFLTAGHPSLAVREATTRGRIRIVPIEDARFPAALESRPYLSFAAIHPGFYPKLAGTPQDDIPTVAMQALLVTRADVPEEVVYALVKAVLAEQTYFRRLHPELAELTPTEMLRGLVAPLHPGAERAYREAGVHQ